MSPELYDLHCHSTASDGALTPAEVVHRAHLNGVTALALTDHDTTSGLAEAGVAATAVGLRLITGIELSTSWQKACFHIVGLGIDPSYAPLVDASTRIKSERLARAEQIALKLEKKRIPGALAAVMQAVGDGTVTRSHFADFLLAQNHVATAQEAFDRYLAKGKPAYVPTMWTDMETAVHWITEAGGVAVLAHPLRYKLTANWMQRFLAAFKVAGGQGIEVITSRCSADDIRLAAGYAERFGLFASVGSDFHNTSSPYVELGRLAPLPKPVRPIWELLAV